MRAWQRLLETVSDLGELRGDRTGVGTQSIFGLSAEFVNTPESFPAVTTKRLAVKQCFAEMALFIQGKHTLADFHALGCTIWDGNGTSPNWQPYVDGDLGRIYGVQWRDWRHGIPGGQVAIDQLYQFVERLKRDPNSRRHIMTTWNPGELAHMCLPPCHIMLQAYVSGEHLDFLVYMRSVDLVLGLPFDVAGYALLQHLVAKEVNLEPRRLLFNFGDAHIYRNHSEAVATILVRTPKAPPRLILAPEARLFDFHPDMATLEGYDPHEAVKAELNV